MKNRIYSNKLSILNLIFIFIKYKTNIKILTLEQSSILVIIVCKFLKLENHMIEYDMGENTIEDKQCHMWSLNHKINEDLTNYLWKKHKNKINYLDTINDKINYLKKKSIIKKDIDIENREFILLWILCQRDKTKEKNDKFNILINNFFINDLIAYYNNRNINIIKKKSFNLIKYQSLLIYLIILHGFLFIPSLIFSVVKKTNKIKKIACKFEKGIHYQNFPDFFWIKNFTKYNNLLVYNDEKIDTKKYKIFKKNLDIFKKNKIKFVNINPLNNPIKYKFYKFTKFYSEILFFRYILNQIKIVIYILNNNRNSLLFFNLKLLINKILGIEYYYALIKKENIGVIFDYAERHHDNLSIACDLNNTIKFGVSWSLKTQQVATFRNTQDIYFAWSLPEIEIFKKSSNFPKYINSGCIFIKSKINKNKFEIKNRSENNTIGILDRSTNKNSAMSKKNYYLFFENLIEYVSKNKVYILIKPKNSNFEKNLYENIKNFDLYKQLISNNIIKIFNHEETIDVLNIANYCIALGINSAGIISNINGLLTFFLDLENHYNEIDENLKLILVKNVNVFNSLDDILNQNTKELIFTKNLLENFYKENSIKYIEDIILKINSETTSKDKEDIIKNIN